MVTPSSSTTNGLMHPLDNPMYEALRTEHSQYAVTSGSAKRFPADIAPFGGLPPGGDQDLRELYHPEETAVILGVGPESMQGWEVLKTFEVIQMTHCADSSYSKYNEAQLLSYSAVSDMLKLTSLVYPSYFRKETASLGEYCGIYSENELIAMAGIRMKIPGFEEISAICTHLDHRGKGLGSAVTSFMIERIRARGNTPFLHTESDNPAQQMYRNVGFEPRAVLPVWVLRRTA